MAELDGVFGMTEMENAATKIVSRCKAAKSWTTPTTFYDMEGEDEQRGFIHLIYRKLLRYAYYKDPFYPTQKFVDLIRERAPAIDLGELSPIVPNDEELRRAQLPQFYGDASL